MNYGNNNAEVRMSLTSPGCPYGPEIFSAVGMVSKTLGFHEKKCPCQGSALETVIIASGDVKDTMEIW